MVLSQSMDLPSKVLTLSKNKKKAMARLTTTSLELMSPLMDKILVESEKVLSEDGGMSRTWN